MGERQGGVAHICPTGLGRGDRLVSFGATPTGGVFALIAAPDGQKELVVAREAGAGAKAGPRSQRRSRSRVEPFARAASDYGYGCLLARRHS